MEWKVVRTMKMSISVVVVDMALVVQEEVAWALVAWVLEAWVLEEAEEDVGQGEEAMDLGKEEGHLQDISFEIPGTTFYCALSS
mmetsp:Transcript_24913/g.41041  ORF Transcript_24913/g.41041 Transcript_24913/m.41041 type:complete len:84 (-) Transcript_24913:362-613(-)